MWNGRMVNLAFDAVVARKLAHAGGAGGEFTEFNVNSEATPLRAMGLRHQEVVVSVSSISKYGVIR